MQGFAHTYFKRFSVSPDCIFELPDFLPDAIVVIPVCDEPHIASLVETLRLQSDSNYKLVVICVINDAESHPGKVKVQNAQTYSELLQLSNAANAHCFRLNVMYTADLPRREQGVGQARKTAMDEAVRIYNHYHMPAGIIVSLDADCHVSNNYVQDVIGWFRVHSAMGFATIRFEHPTRGNEFNDAVYKAVAAYELHLRYFRLGLQYAGYPHAIHTIGSCFALRAQLYCKAGGMNRRQAGEDFYFLHKLTAISPFGHILDACVYPSPRVSCRVPFGTGPAIAETLKTGQQLSYSTSLFEMLQRFYATMGNFRTMNNHEVESSITHIHPALSVFCRSVGFFDKLHQAKSNTANAASFEKRMFQVFDAFMVIRFLNEASRHHAPLQAVELPAAELLQRLKYNVPGNSGFDLLLAYRELEKA